MANNTGCELTGFPKARVGKYGRAISQRPSKLKLKMPKPQGVESTVGRTGSEGGTLVAHSGGAGR